ncbi:MAG: cellulase family glycosylhydrolase [Actinomycetota bacterium]
MRASFFRCAVLALAISVLTAGPAAAAPGSHPGHAGRWITDDRGRVLDLHGVNMVYKQAPYYPSVAGFGDDDAAFLASEGYDTVRVGIIYKAVEPQPGVYNDAYLAQIANTVRTLGRHGIWSMLDFHQDMYNERFQGEGWPDWAVQDDGLPAAPKNGFPLNYLTMPALQHAFDHFWANSPGPGGVGLQDRYAAAWQHVAAYFRHTPWVLGYELLNEPWPGTTWAQCVNPQGCPLFDALLTQFNKRSIAAIRQADPTTLVWYEPNVLFNNGPATQLGDVGDSHAGFAFHDYCLAASGDTYPRDACMASDDMVFANALKRAATTGDALALTEFGATNNTQLLEDMVDRADSNMVPWFYWAYCGCFDPTTSGPGDTQAIVRDPSKPPSGDNLESFKLDVLSRPHPYAIAGTPQSFDFDPQTKKFKLVYKTARAGGGRLSPGVPTEISLPRRQYPGGYTAIVNGARIRSAPGSSTLRIRACRGAGKVRVRVKPAAGKSRDSC